MAESNKNIQVRRPQRPSGGLSLMPEFEDLIERFFGRGMMREMTSMRRAASDIQETENSYILSAEVPGIPKEDIEINVSGNVLTVHAEHKEESGQPESAKGYHREYSSFHQSFTLPTTIDQEKIEANYENGLLEILLPKTAKAQPKRIDIRSEAGGFLGRVKDKLSGKEQSTESPRH